MPDTATCTALRPCPFCGTVPEGAIEIDVATWAVPCQSCQTIGPLAGDERRAAELWNARPAS